MQVTDQPLTSLRVMDTGRIAAVGSADGSTTIVQFSDGLIDMQPNEKQALTSVSPSCHLHALLHSSCMYTSYMYIVCIVHMYIIVGIIDVCSGRADVWSTVCGPLMVLGDVKQKLYPHLLMARRIFVQEGIAKILG